MQLFLELEIVYIVIGLFALAVTLFVTTRGFMPKVAFKRGVTGVSLIFIIMITLHYNITTTRMDNVAEIFNAGETVICENKMKRHVSRSQLISSDMGWKLKDAKFINPDYERDFHTSRCIEFDGIVPK